MTQKRRFIIVLGHVGTSGAVEIEEAVGARGRVVELAHARPFRSLRRALDVAHGDGWNTYADVVRIREVG